MNTARIQSSESFGLGEADQFYVGPGVDFSILLTEGIWLSPNKRGLLFFLLKLYLSFEIPHFREFLRYAQLFSTPVSDVVVDILRLSTSVSVVVIKAVTFKNTDLTSQSPVCLTDVRVDGDLYVTIF
jgi:hypothetical protein